jgi:hypothetical protein
VHGMAVGAGVRDVVHREGAVRVRLVGCEDGLGLALVRRGDRALPEGIEARRLLHLGGVAPEVFQRQVEERHRGTVVERRRLLGLAPGSHRPRQPSRRVGSHVSTSRRWNTTQAATSGGMV